MATLKLTDARKSFGSTEVIKGVDIEIDDGEFVVFVGPSGCGKSTLLRMISGLEDITSGTLEIDGDVVNDLEPKQRGIAMVFQTYAIFPHMTVRENVAFGLTIAGASKEEKEEKVAYAARATLAANRRVIQTVRLMGAEDRFVSAAFVRRLAGRVALGGLAGALAATGLLALLPSIEADAALGASISPGPVGWAVLALAVPLAGTAVAWITAHYAVMAVLRRMP